ncbi:hypothetical protein [Candidatus Azoamicus ciliaticola]|uniref:Uncharacterized protein n=1 Tax=Candidatus Azoamicus ciliaticola TaxID=2652803 RepID=A0A6J5JY22_9GAMM|nr:hypothetical protein [Candidatus Azoamicus ciliaticola]CAB3976233.1 Uncharacterised protein [Candidatus Azoamicus ciliaticola]
MIYNIITSTPNTLIYLINEKITKDAFKTKLIKLNIYNIKLKRKKKIQK